ncbi:arabinan endo-1,5-alpha-L-arabinosidase [Stenotrophomonas panacihumi]|uniref:Arabinan endo-1,5-alpha-L-arabinosidase n=1 Tax=Stenotrophomonas panacihumi TaxID=676599 RepID=A0A0R0AU94_9GAMM|nr:glycoside hydrolase family 43 protein [Stenotrophomonas panacihumi]KRG44200.1 arabinan endo-1,5-alpha-L-arabinosidase [Stenotrophomonas panacihumi]PTN56239.1 arabinan endo-1,5-alpha-L-arabinosidase [Stenotrophomonas panacihumi]
MTLSKKAMAAVLAATIGGWVLPTPAQTPATTAKTSGNPILPGWYADPEAAVFGKTYWIYPTRSTVYAQQVGFDAFSSPDLVHWTRHPDVLSIAAVSWARQALWAPSVVEKDGKYYLFFAANDIQSDDEVGGIGVAVADRPEGPYHDLLGKPLVGAFHNGAQPIDQFVFKDDDGTWYMIYGGWRHANIVRLKDDFTGVLPLADGTLFKEITPAPEYVEGSLMFKRGGHYYYMWSEGGWGGPDYSVAYAIADVPTGPFKRIGKILQQDPKVATSAGHHSLIHVADDDSWYIVYHRRPLGDTARDHRVVAIDRMSFDAQGHILPVKMTTEGVAAHPLR